ncbi:MAG TPA: hypothetical protein ENL01_03475 [Chlorobaculum parvum]|uniref:Uncharacterized protein n=1 Tax=Chlorobaculum parvum TaxID=274539 RepID=A0A7C5DEM5_9CHLB|nr:hypothetical protein [Chlorobaculum parvum]
MRTITTDERQLILDVTGEGLTPLPAAALEKDVFVTEVLQRLTDIDAEGIQLIFCGGTCLSKASQENRRGAFRESQQGV